MKSNHCVYNDAYILVRGNITIAGDNGAQAAFKNCAPFIKCITKNGFGLWFYGLWFYSKNKANNFNADISTNNALKSFEYKIKVVGDIET